MKILLIDDDPSILLMASRALEKNGHFEVIQLQDSVEAIGRIAAERPDVIIVDLMMPELDGSALLKELKSDEKMSDIPVIFLTGSSHSKDVDRLLTLGAKGVILKPFDPMALVGEVQKILKG